MRASAPWMAEYVQLSTRHGMQHVRPEGAEPGGEAREVRMAIVTCGTRVRGLMLPGRSRAMSGVVVVVAAVGVWGARVRQRTMLESRY